MVLDRNRIGSSKSERQIPKVRSKFCQIILYPFDRHINSKTTAEGCNFNNRNRFPKTFNHSGACSPVNWLSQTRGYLTNQLLNLNFASRRKFCVLWKSNTSAFNFTNHFMQKGFLCVLAHSPFASAYHFQVFPILIFYG